MCSKIVKRRSERIRRKKETVYIKCLELGELPGIDIALVTIQNGQYSMYTLMTFGRQRKTLYANLFFFFLIKN
jgi:hypothetical protein